MLCMNEGKNESSVASNTGKWKLRIVEGLGGELPRVALPSSTLAPDFFGPHASRL